MQTPLKVSLALALSLVLAGCGFSESRLNPFNWFGSDREEPQTLAPEGGYAAAKTDNRALIAQLTRVEVKQTQGGAIISAEGIAPTQGWWDAELVAESEEPVDGVMSYRFVIAEPRAGSPAAGRVLTPESRAITAGAYIPNARLPFVTKIIVTGANGARSVSR